MSRLLTLGAGAVLAGSVFVGPMLTTGPAPAPAIPVVSQDVTLTADWTDMLDMSTLTLGDVLGIIGFDGNEPFTDLIDQYLGDWGDQDLNTLLGEMLPLPDLTVGGILGMAGLTIDETITDALTLATNMLGTDLNMSLGDVAALFAYNLDDSFLTDYGLTAASTLADVLDSDAVGAALGLGGALGDLSFGDLLGGVGADASLTDMALAMLGLDGDETFAQAALSLLGLDGDATLIDAMGAYIGIDLDSNTLVTDLMAALGTIGMP